MIENLLIQFFLFASYQLIYKYISIFNVYHRNDMYLYMLNIDLKLFLVYPLIKLKTFYQKNPGQFAYQKFLIKVKNFLF